MSVSRLVRIGVVLIFHPPSSSGRKYNGLSRGAETISGTGPDQCRRETPAAQPAGSVRRPAPGCCRTRPRNPRSGVTNSLIVSSSSSAGTKGTSTDESSAPCMMGALEPIRITAPRSLPGRSALGITLMQCMQCTHSLVFDRQLLAIPAHALGGTVFAHILLDIEARRPRSWPPRPRPPEFRPSRCR